MTSGVFIDTSYYLALVASSDQHHAKARAVAEHLHPPAVTSAWVLAELLNACSATRWRLAAWRMVAAFRAEEGATVVEPSWEWHDRGLALYGSRADKSWSLTDCISFSIMAEFGLTQALTTDHHFIQAGYEALLLT